MPILTTVALICAGQLPCKAVKKEIESRPNTKVVFVEQGPYLTLPHDPREIRDIVTQVEAQHKLSFSVVVVATPHASEKGYVLQHFSCLLSV